MSFTGKEYDLWRCIRNLESAELFSRRLAQDADGDLISQVGLYVDRQRDKAQEIVNTFTTHDAVKFGFLANIIQTFNPGDDLWPAYSRFFHRDIKPPEDR